MENTVTQQKDVTAEMPFTTATHKKWCEENVLKLAHHFHRLKGTQYRRVTCFELKDIDGFNGIRKEITDIKIYLALEEKSRKKKVTFCPYLLINNDEDMKFYLHPSIKRPPLKTNVGNSTNSEEVPEIFKDMIWKNWDEVEMHQIDDLFHCRDKQKKEKEEDLECIVRVEYFKLDIATSIAQAPEDLQAITLFPGIDMNKFNKKDKISFTPVLGIKPPIDITKGQNGIGLMESNDEFTFVEYSSPCPPTCTDDDSK